MHCFKGITPSNKPSKSNLTSKKIGKYTIERTIGFSKYKTKKVFDETDPNTFFVIKSFQSKKIINSHPFFERERNAYLTLNHPNILKMIDDIEYQKYSKTLNKIISIKAIVLEYAPKKDLFEYLEKTGPFSEDMARMLFKQVLLGVKHIHDNGLAHLDLKPDNFFFTEDFRLKIGDFDLARSSIEVLRNEKNGTAGYYAPEIIDNVPCYGNKVDIFTLGIVLFIICTQCPPFHNAKANDPLYRLILSGSFSSFWKPWEERRGIKLSQELKELLHSLWCYDPAKRPEISEILDCKWMNIVKEDVGLYQKEMKERYARFA